MDKQVFVLGSVNYDLMVATERMPEQGETINGTGFKEAIGGKGNNQASASARLGAATKFIGCVGDDMYGELTSQDLKDFGADITHLKVDPDNPTGTAVIITMESDNRIIINSGANSSVDLAQVEKALESAKVGDIFITQFENPLEIVLKATQMAHEKGMTTILNPAPAVEFPHEYYESIDYLIVNETETEILSGIYPENEADCKKAGEIFRKRGVKHLIITLGSKGAAYISGDEFIYKPSYKISVKDTTGAGDTFIGAFVYGLTQDWSIEEQLEFSNACGALACSEYGAKAGMPHLNEVQEFLNN